MFKNVFALSLLRTSDSTKKNNKKHTQKKKNVEHIRIVNTDFLTAFYAYDKNKNKQNKKKTKKKKTKKKATYGQRPSEKNTYKRKRSIKMIFFFLWIWAHIWKEHKMTRFSEILIIEVTFRLFRVQKN